MLRLSILVVYLVIVNGYQVGNVNGILKCATNNIITKLNRNNVLINDKHFRRTIQLNAAPQNTEIDNNSNNNGTLPQWILAFLTACLGGSLFGLDIGSSSTALRIFGTGSTLLGTLDPLQLGQVASGSLFGAILSSAIIIVVGDKSIGRKKELQIAALLFLCGTAVQTAAQSFPLLIAGRIIFGLGIGTAMHAAPLFIAETAPSSRRGQLISYKEAAIVAGIVLGYATGSFYGSDLNWQGVFTSALPLEALMLLGALNVPESPRWLALRGRRSEAEDSLQKLQAITSDDEVTRQVNGMMMDVTNTNNNNSGFISQLQDISSSKYNRRALTIGVGLVLFQQLSGQPSVLYFANRIFETAGLGFEAAVGVGLFKLAMTFLSASLVENPKFGRRTLLLYGNAGVTLSLLILSYLYGVAPDQATNEVVNSFQSLLEGPQAGIIGAILAFVGFYQVGFGPITWLVLSEVFPLQIRSTAVSLGTLANFSSNLLVTLIFEAERLKLGESALFLQFGLIALVATIFTYTFVFETRGLSLEEIETKLKSEVDK